MSHRKHHHHNRFLLAITGIFSAVMMPAHAAADAAPTEYPAAWQVQYTAARALPKDYAFGHQTQVLKKGSVFPPASMPLPCDVTWERDIPVKLRDGVTIYTDVLRPVNATRAPAIVAWSPYGKSIPLNTVQSGVDPSTVTGLYKSEGPDAGFWVCHGYAVVNPDPRGVGKSEGNIHVWGSVDAQDGHDVIEWIATQPWSNGKVGMHGTSWLSMAQWFIAATHPPHLAAIAPWNGLSDIYRQNLMFGGIPNFAFGGMIIAGLKGSSQVERPDLTAATHPLLDAYWADKAAKLEDVTVPAYVGVDVITDLHRMGSFEGFRRLGSREKWLRVNNNQEWTDQYNVDNQRDLLKFFDHYLKGESNGWAQTPRVRMTVLDPGRTDRINAPYPSWPIPGTKYLKLHLDASSNTLTRSTSNKTATARYEAKDGQVQFTYRFKHNTQMTGYLKTRLWVEANGARDMDLFVLVEKLDENGKLLVPNPVAAQQYLPVPPAGPHGRVRVSLRDLDLARSTPYMPVQSFNKSKPLSPGEIVPVELAIMPHSILFRAGEQLRLTIAGHEFQGASSNSAQIMSSITGQASGSSSGHEEAGTPLANVETTNAGTHIIHTGGRFDAYLQLPLVPPVTSADAKNSANTAGKKAAPTEKSSGAAAGADR